MKMFERHQNEIWKCPSLTSQLCCVFSLGRRERTQTQWVERVEKLNCAVFSRDWLTNPPNPHCVFETFAQTKCHWYNSEQNTNKLFQMSPEKWGSCNIWKEHECWRYKRHASVLSRFSVDCQSFQGFLQRHVSPLSNLFITVCVYVWMCEKEKCLSVKTEAWFQCLWEHVCVSCGTRQVYPERVHMKNILSPLLSPSVPLRSLRYHQELLWKLLISFCIPFFKK